MSHHEPDSAALEAAILALVRQPDYRPMKSRQIARRLGLSKDQVPEVKKLVKNLVRAGRLGHDGKRLVAAGEGAPPSPAKPKAPVSANRVLGTFRRASGGFGFVRPSPSATEGEVQDIYITVGDTADASTGDTVLVQLVRRTGPKRFGPQGAIVEIIDRQTHQFVGTYFERGGSGYVQVDGTLFAQPIFVGDPGAKGARPDDKVVLEMVRFPSHARDGEGVITEVLGLQGKPGVDTLCILREFDLPEGFAEDALDEARRLADAFDEAVPPDRLDLTGQMIITIDPPDARDFDDAISLEQSDDGQWRLGVHIADVSHFVQPKTALDREARARATSVYLPDRVIPMLPEVLSNSLASLQPGKTRFTKSAFLDFTPEGLPVATELRNSVICSAKRLTYEQVDQFLADPDVWRRKLGVKVHELLLHMHRLAMILRRRRLKRGALELSLREVKVDLDRQGRVCGAHVVENTESHQIIEEFMLAANEAVAEEIQRAGLPFLRRIHRAPTERKMAALTDFVTELGFRVESLQDRFALQKLLDDVAGRPEQHAVNYAVLRSMQRAVYGPAEEGHYALASECYCHFTSPIRRYPDLTAHRLVEAIVAKRKPHGQLDELAALGQHCSDQEQLAEKAERELTKLKLLGYLSGQIGLEMDAIVTGVESFGLFAQGVDLPAEGLVPVASLADDYYRFDRASHTLAGHRSGNIFRLGDTLRVKVARVDVERREMDFHIVRHISRPEPPRRSRKAKSPRTKPPASRGRRKRA